MRRTSFLIAVAVVSFSCVAFAAETKEDIIAAFRSVGELAAQNIKVPTVGDVPLNYLPASRPQMAVYDATEKSFAPYDVVHKDSSEPVRIKSNKSQGQDRFLNDQKYETYVDFDLPEDRAGEATLTFASAKPFASDALWIGLANHVTMPENIEIRAEVNGAMKIIVAERDRRGVCTGCIVFPETTSAKWQVKLRYGQPLRISEIAFNQVNRKASMSLRFLMQPEHTYKIFREPDRDVSISVGEAGDLRGDKDVLNLAAVVFTPNAAYRESDIDKDGVPDIRDNCVSVANEDQADINGNLRGDACDDYDHDSIINSKDNCPNVPNHAQQDTDGDDIGDVCDKEESRLTEKYPWLSWLALGGVAALMLFFFVRVAKGEKKE